MKKKKNQNGNYFIFAPFQKLNSNIKKFHTTFQKEKQMDTLLKSVENKLNTSISDKVAEMPTKVNRNLLKSKRYQFYLFNFKSRNPNN